MKNLSAILTIALAALAIPHLALAQNLRANNTLYFRPHTGLAGYMGDNSRSFMTFDGAFPISAGVEMGYQFSTSTGVGIGYTYDRYPNMTSSKDTDGRHTVEATVRHLFGRSSGAAPYVQGGGFTTFGEVIPSGETRKERRTAFGPVVGLGVDVPVSGRVSLFLESNFRAAFPDDALDGIDDGGFGNFDLRSNFATGLKVNVGKGLVAARVFSLSGPRTLQTGKTGDYRAVVNEKQATKPAEYSWDWGDGTRSKGIDAAHAFARAGTFTVKFTTSNRAGSGSESMVVVVTDPPMPPSVVSIKADPPNPDTHTPVRFTAGVRGDAPLRFAWKLDDETTSDASEPVHTFDRPGTYTVTLEVSNELGSDRRSLDLKVQPYEAEICSEIMEMTAAFFERNESALTAEGRRALRDNAAILGECPNMNVRVEGHAGPGERQPQRLSEARARAVEAFYVEKGIAPTRLDVRGLGSSRGMTSKKDGARLYQRVDTIPNR